MSTKLFVTALSLTSAVACVTEMEADAWEIETSNAETAHGGKADGAELFGLNGSLAQSVYKAMNVKGASDGAYHTTKSIDGDLTCVMRSPWGAASTVRCSMGTAFKLEGAVADRLFGALPGEGAFDGAYHTTKTVHGSLRCTLRTPWGGPSTYLCGFDGAAPEPELDDELLDISGSLAKTVFQTLTVAGQFDGAYHTTKTATGQLSCVTRTPWGGRSSTSCTLGAVLNLTGTAAKSFAGAFGVEGESDGAYHTTQAASGTLRCVQRTPSGGPIAYSCTFAR